MGKKKIKVEDSVDGKVNLSPMIDCCFLLLIFFVVNATALTVSKDPSVAMPQTVDPTDLENAEGCIVVNVFDPPSLIAGASSGDDKIKKAAVGRINKMKKSYLGATDPEAVPNDAITPICYGMTSFKKGSSPKYFTKDQGKELKEYIEEEKKGLTELLQAKFNGISEEELMKKIRVYIRADVNADWSRTYGAIRAANEANIPTVVFGSIKAKE